MTQTFGPFASGAGASLGQDPYLDFLGPMLQGDGVNTNVIGGSALQVYGNSSGLQVLVRSGSALVRGVMYSNTADVTLAIGANSSGSTRIDRVVLRMNRGAATVSLVVIAGTPGGTPVPPAITQTVGGTWDITLAQVRVVTGATTIAPGDVSDERVYLPMKVAYCDTSYATPPVDGSMGRLFYDKNPAVLGFIATDGTTWSPVVESDSGWVNLTFAGTNWSTSGYGPQVRRRGKLVEFRVDGLSTATFTGNTGTWMCTLPVGYRPGPAGRLFPVAADASGAGSAIPISPLVGIDSNGKVVVNGGKAYNGSDIGWDGVRFLINVSFLAG